MNVDSALMGDARGAVEAHEAGGNAGDAKLNKVAPVKLRGGRWRVLPPLAGMEDGRVRIRAYTTLQHWGVLTLDFDKLIEEPKQFALFKFEGGGEALELDRLLLPEDLRRHVLQLLASQGVPLLVRHCLDLERLVREFDSCCLRGIHAEVAVAQAFADASRLSAPVIADAASTPHSLSVCGAAKAFGKAMFSVEVLASVFGLAEGYGDFAGKCRVGSLRQEAGTVVDKLRRCRDGLREAGVRLGVDASCFEF